MNARLTTRMEIAFWDLWIHMLTESVWFRNAVRQLYRLLPYPSLRQSLRVFSSLAAVGFARGILLYFVLAHIE
jgi:hypothetical protein